MNDLLCPSEFSNLESEEKRQSPEGECRESEKEATYDFFVSKGSKSAVSPSVYTELMTEHVLRLNHFRTTDRTRSDDEESRFEVLSLEEIQETGRVR